MAEAYIADHCLTLKEMLILIASLVIPSTGFAILFAVALERGWMEGRKK